MDLVPFTGFTGSVALACTDAATASTCTVQPATVSVTGTAPLPIQVNVTTAAGSTAASANPDASTPYEPIAPALARLLLVAMALIILSTAVSARGPRHTTQLAQSVAITALLAISLAACFGGSSATNTTGTPAGSYTLAVTATYTPAGSSTTVTRSIPLTLVVQ